jgi:hypothetical protein
MPYFLGKFFPLFLPQLSYFRSQLIPNIWMIFTCSGWVWVMSIPSILCCFFVHTSDICQTIIWRSLQSNRVGWTTVFDSGHELTLHLLFHIHSVPMGPPILKRNSYGGLTPGVLSLQANIDVCGVQNALCIPHIHILSVVLSTEARLDNWSNR